MVSRQLATFFTFKLFSWQQTFMAWCACGKNRAAKRVVFDSSGNNGKSIMIEYMEYLGLAFEMPLFRDKKNFAGYASRLKKHQMYVIDTPPATRKNGQKVFYSEAAGLKNVTVFTNVIPSKEVIEKGNWQVWELTKENTMRRYTFL